jgi:APA family basic amino acid/polyamine antiporter
MRVMRSRGEGTELEYRSRFNLRVRGIDWPLFAILGGLGTGLSWLVIVIKSPSIRYAGIAWLLIGLVFYVVYRRRVLNLPLAETVRAPIPLGPALALEYRNVLVPVVGRHESEAAVDLACRLATERGASIVALTVIEVPLELPLDAELATDAEDRANDLLDEVRAIGDAYGVNVIGRLGRGRRAGRAIVAEAAARHSEIIVLGSPRRDVHQRRGKIFGGTVDYVLKNAPCRVLVAASRRAA